MAFLQDCDLTDVQRQELTATNRMIVQPTGCMILAPPEIVLSLTPSARDRIYAELEKSPLNPLQQAPFFVCSEDADIWLSRVDLPREKVAQLMNLTYRRGNARCFCDVELAQHILTPDEYRALLRALYSTDTLMVLLHLKTDDPIDTLAAYWGWGGRTSRIKAMLESVSHVPGGATINIAALLPPLPRSWLNTYPEPPPPGQQYPDCYYSSLNFFRKTPEPRFLEVEFRSAAFRQEYRVVPEADQLGDIIVIVDARGITQHACVHIADDIVFTKNGTDGTHPWVLMRLSAVRAIYDRQPGGSQVVFRHRTL